MSAQELGGADGGPAGVPIRLIAFDAAFDRSVFDCGEQAVNDWFRRQAGQSQRSNNARTILAVQGVRVVGRGLGVRLLVHALENFLAVADKVGVEVILVDALTTELCAFYRKMGFRSLEDRRLRMFMPVKVLRPTFDASS